MENGCALLNDSFEKDIEKTNTFYQTNSTKEAVKLNYITEIKKDENIFIEKEDFDDINLIITELNNAVQINLDVVNDNIIGCKEIISILKKPKRSKIMKYKANKVPFKNLSKPKKISLKSRVLTDIPSNNDTQSSSNQYTTTISTVSINNASNNKKIKIESNKHYYK